MATSGRSRRVTAVVIAKAGASGNKAGIFSPPVIEARLDRVPPDHACYDRGSIFAYLVF